MTSPSRPLVEQELQQLREQVRLLNQDLDKHEQANAQMARRVKELETQLAQRDLEGGAAAKREPQPFVQVQDAIERERAYGDQRVNDLLQLVALIFNNERLLDN